MDWWLDEISLSGGISLVIALALILLLPIVLPKGSRSHVRMPLVLLAVHVVLLVWRGFVHDEARADDALRIASLFFLLASIVRSGYLIVLHVIVMRTLGIVDVPRIMRDLVQALLFVGVALITLNAAGVEPGSLLTTSALLTAVIGLSLQDTLGNLFAGLAIQAQRPFTVGDWIGFDEDDTHVGRVIEINWRTVRVETLDKFEMTIPNSAIARTALRNYSKPSRIARRRAYVSGPYDKPPERVMPELEKAVRDVSGVLSEPPPSVLIRDFTESGVKYEVRYYINEFEQREVIAGLVRERLWYAMQRMGIDIPVPQRLVRMFDYTEERLQHEAEARVEALDESLRRVDFLRALPQKARHDLAESVATRMYAPGELVIRKGDEGSELFIVRSGSLAVELGEGLSQREVARLKPGQFFGEMSLMTGETRTASVRAVTETELLVIGKDALQGVLEDAPDLAETISRILAERSAALAEAASMSQSDKKRTVERETTVLLDRIKRFFSLAP